MNIIWSALANTTFTELLDYLESSSSEKTALELYQKTYRLLDTLKKNQYLCPPSKAINCRKCTINKRTSLVYRINEESIELITFLDNRTNHRF